jgi:uncharacterized protein (DUF2235 family)
MEGVGANGKIIGMAMGAGIEKRAKIAYAFLLDNYHPGKDEIYIFGFSRGAYAARILAAMLHFCGLPVRHEKIDTSAFVDKLYHVYKGEMDGETRTNEINRALTEQGLAVAKLVPVAVLGLWDTVEALGLPNYGKVDIEPKHNRYGDQLCNVERALHAVSIDDDRARAFAPVLLTRPYLVKDCKEVVIDKVVDEVWFRGAHADVGGGYRDRLLGGISLNWMIRQLRDRDSKSDSKVQLLPSKAGVREDPKEESHDPEHGLLWGMLYRKLSRDLPAYTEKTDYNGGKLKLHRSVIERLKKSIPEKHEFQWGEKYPKCFNETENGYTYIEASRCFDIVE